MGLFDERVAFEEFLTNFFKSEVIIIFNSCTGEKIDYQELVGKYKITNKINK